MSTGADPRLAGPEGTAVVLGATGLVGRAVLDQLAQAHHVGRVVAIARRPLAHPSPKVEVRVLDFERLHAQPDLLAGRWLFCCLGTTRRKAGSLAAQRHVDLELPLSAARLGLEAGMRHLLLVSSALAHARSPSAYLRLKGELEAAVSALPLERVSLFRPSVLLGEREESRPGEAAAAWLLSRLAALPWLSRYRPIPAEQLARRMVQVSAQPGPARECFALDQAFPAFSAVSSP